MENCIASSGESGTSFHLRDNFQRLTLSAVFPSARKCKVAPATPLPGNCEQNVFAGTFFYTLQETFVVLNAI
jgi:hypothetical protein